MLVDVPRIVNATVRSVESRFHEGAEARVVIAARTYDTTIDDLWDALTNKERIPRWFLPVSGDLRLGGRYQLTGNASGTITKCEPPRAVGMTWEFAGQTSWVEVRLRETSTEHTYLELEHITRPDAHWDRFGPGATGVGWDMALMGLELHIATGQPNNPEEGMAWMMSENGKDFTRHSSDDWYRAAVASGIEPSVARGMADRTTAAFTGADVPPADNDKASDKAP